MKTISIVTPCFNEADNVEACRDAVAALFAPGAPLEGYGREHIFADNDSSDGTQDILRTLAGSDPSMKVILNAVDYKDRDPTLDFSPDPAIVVSGAEETALMEAERRRSGRFAG